MARNNTILEDLEYERAVRAWTREQLDRLERKERCRDKGRRCR